MISIEEIYKIFLEHPVVSTDSRNEQNGSLFFALKGDNFNGNNFASNAIYNGASYAIVDDPSVVSGRQFILVQNTLSSLQQLASFHQARMPAKIIGITGSNGKTTTKELIGRVLSTSFKTVITQGNLNNHIGVPLTLLSMTNDTSFAVVEMGANHPGEIAGLCRLARPGFGIITNIGKAHLEGFGSIEGVAKAKSELYQYLRVNNGMAFVNDDNPKLKAMVAGMRSISYGTGLTANCTGKVISEEPYLTMKWSSGNYDGIARSSLIGRYNVENILAAICVGTYFRIEPDSIDEAVLSYKPENNRSQLVSTGRNEIILDAYNANPSSMKAALENFSRMPGASKMAILGDMLELGEYSPAEHKEILAFAKSLSFDKLILIGEHFMQACKGGREICFRNAAETVKWFNNHQVTGMTILLKGSRKMQLEKLSEIF